MTERVRLGIGDERSHRAVGRDAEDRTRLVAADVEVAGGVEDETVREDAGEVG